LNRSVSFKRLIRIARRRQNWRVLAFSPLVSLKILCRKIKFEQSFFLNPSESFYYQQYTQFITAKSKSFTQGSKILETSRMNWLIVPISPEGGGAKTISRFIKFFDELEIKQNVLIWTATGIIDLDGQKEIWRNHLGINEKIGIMPYKSEEVDGFVIATAWQTAIPSMMLAEKNRRLYFIQDDERTFEAVGDSSNLVQMAIQEFSFAITAGPWLERIAIESGISASTHFNFAADKIYSSGKNRKENTLVCYFQPGKPRRMSALLMATLDVLCTIKPEIEIILVGGGISSTVNRNIRNLGVLLPIDLATVYNSSSVGLVLSATNASLIPYEMRACGVGVVTNVGEHSEWLGNDLGIKYVAADPILLANAICEILDSRVQIGTLKFDWDTEINQCIDRISRITNAESLFPEFIRSKI
jgi:O-antigen biosynthesis protein